MRAGRNDPCPCGSGKKFKKCHLAEQAAAGDAARRAAATHELDERIKERILDYAKSELSVSGKELQKLYPVELAEEDLQMFIPLIVYEAKIREGLSIGSHFLAKRASRLTPAERAWLESQLRSHLSAWEILAIDRGRGMSARDRITGETRFVHEVLASQTLTDGDTILARVVDHEDLATFCGMHPRALKSAAANAFVAQLAIEGTVSLADLRKPGTAERLLVVWEDAVEGSTPKLTTTDGDELVFVNDIYEANPIDHDEIKRRLTAVADKQAGGNATAATRPPSRWEPSKDDEVQLVFVRPSDATVIGNVSLGGTHLTIETMSTKRADDLRELVETACGELLRHEQRIEDDAREIMNMPRYDFDA